jgi:glycosyltransferase involved in cell wall biosynthesis
VKIVAHMLVRNEADVITETLTEISRWGIGTVVVLDGGSDDGTIEQITQFAASSSLTVDLNVIPDPDDRFHDHQRNVLLELTRRHNPDWIISLDADEIYHTNPVAAIHAAERARGNVVWCDVPQFWITVADVKAGLLVEDESVSVQERRRWYSWGHTGCFIWRESPLHYYPKSTPKRTPELTGYDDYRLWQRPGPVRPICKHYCFRSLRQALKRMDERLERGGRRYFGKYALDWIIDQNVASLHYFDGEWVREYNHSAVYAYMGRHRQ